MITRIIIIVILLFIAGELRSILDAVQFNDARITNIEAAKP